MREEVYSQVPGASTLQGRSGEQRRCRSSTTPSKASLERENKLFSKGNGGMIARLRDIMEISGKMTAFPRFGLGFRFPAGVSPLWDHSISSA